MELKRDVVDIDGNKCPYCSQYLVKFEVFDVDRPPPDKEWSGLVDRLLSRPVETIEEMLDRKFWLKKLLSKPTISDPKHKLQCRGYCFS